MAERASRLQTFTHQSPIGHWSVSVWQPDPRLSELIASMWFGEGKTAYQRDRILPSGNSQLLINLGPEPFTVTRGMRIAQLVVAPVSRARLVERDGLDDTARGAGGFGSSGLAAVRRSG